MVTDPHRANLLEVMTGEDQVITGDPCLQYCKFRREVAEPIAWQIDTKVLHKGSYITKALDTILRIHAVSQTWDLSYEQELEDCSAITRLDQYHAPYAHYSLVMLPVSGFCCRLGPLPFHLLCVFPVHCPFHSHLNAQAELFAHCALPTLYHTAPMETAKAILLQQQCLITVTTSTAQQVTATHVHGGAVAHTPTRAQ